MIPSRKRLLTEWEKELQSIYLIKDLGQKLTTKYVQNFGKLIGEQTTQLKTTG